MRVQGDLYLYFVRLRGLHDAVTVQTTPSPYPSCIPQNMQLRVVMSADLAGQAYGPKQV